MRDTIEEIFVLLLQALSEKHLSTGFAAAIEQMRAYRPAEHEETTSVAPLLQFFELVHIGDTMQSMVQVYFDKEMVSGVGGGERSERKMGLTIGRPRILTEPTS